MASYNDWHSLEKCGGEDCDGWQITYECADVRQCEVCKRFDIEPIYCKCENIEVRERTYRDGRKALFNQCVDCGSSHGTAIKRTPELEANGKIKPWAEAKAFDMYSFERIRSELERERRDYMSKAAKIEHVAYLDSDEWKALRLKVLKRDDYLCQGCLTEKATEVHHMTYRHWKEEFAWELYAVCRSCHERYHENEKKDNDRG